jgi:hypothetical protein
MRAASSISHHPFGDVAKEPDVVHLLEGLALLAHGRATWPMNRMSGTESCLAM